MCPPQKDQQLRWSVSPWGSKLDSLKHVFHLSVFHFGKRSLRVSLRQSCCCNYISYSVVLSLDWSETKSEAMWDSFFFFFSFFFLDWVKSEPFIRKKYSIGFSTPSSTLLPDCYRHLQPERREAVSDKGLKWAWIGISPEVCLLCLFQPRPRNHLEEG